MDDIELMKMLHGFDNLACEHGSLSFRKPSSIFESLIKLASRCVLEDHIDSFLIEEEAIELEDVLVLQMTVYL